MKALIFVFICINVIVGKNEETLEEKIKSDFYFEVFSVPTSEFTYTNNGEEFDKLSNAFNLATDEVFRSQKENTNSFKNKIDVFFKKEVSLAKVLYQGNSISMGFPKIATLSFWKDNKLVDSIQFKREPTKEKIVYVFSPITCDKFQFEFTEIEDTSKLAIAKEIAFFVEETTALKKVYNLFSDFKKHEIKDEFKDKEIIESLKNELKNLISYDSSVGPLLDRAEQILNKTFAFDKRRQFTTKKDVEGIPLQQWGNLREHAYYNLKFVWFGTNKQSTGIYAFSGEKIKVYVDGNKEEKMPSIAFTQYYGHYGSFQKKFKLKPGLNEFVFPVIPTGRLTSPSVKNGGPIYIENPCFPSEQKSGVTIYIEGGNLFPIFRKGSDEEQYVKDLEEYLKDFDSDKKFDLTDIDGQHALLSITARSALKAYKDRTKSPQENIEIWDSTIRKILIFDGVQFDEKDPYYSPLNQHMKVNIRLSQSLLGAAAYAYTDHIGIFLNEWIELAANTTFIEWGYAHEIGHEMDINQRLVSETSNEMISKFERSGVRGSYLDSKEYEGIFNSLLRDAETTNFWDPSKKIYSVWWLIEMYKPGYWGTQDNMYRYNASDLIDMNISSTETQVYFSSVATGVDLTYYFLKLGYYISNYDKVHRPFKREEFSANFTKLMEDSISKGLFTNKIKPKIWYYDDAQYQYKITGKNLTLYSEEVPVEVPYVKRVDFSSDSDKIRLLLILPQPENKELHLGYEIYKKNVDTGNFELIDFTRGFEYKESNYYSLSNLPVYAIRAFDRDLKFSAISGPTSLDDKKNVEVNGVEYFTIKEAILAVQSGGTIKLKGDINEANIEVLKSIKIETDTTAEKVYIKRMGSGPIFRVSLFATLTIEDPKIVIDGGNYLQIGSTIHLEPQAKANLSNITIQNNYHNSRGAAIFMKGSFVTLYNVTFKNNMALSGGVIYTDSIYSTLNDTSSTYYNNTAEGQGGAIHLICEATIKDSKFISNKAKQGGAIYKKNTKLLLTGVNITENVADEGAGLYLESQAIVSNAIITKNYATRGGGIFYSNQIDSQGSEITLTKFFENNAKENGKSIYSKSSKSSPLKVSECNFTQKQLRNLQEKSGSQNLYVKEGEVTIESGETPDFGLISSDKYSVNDSDNNVVITSNQASVIVKSKKQSELQNGNVKITVVGLNKENSTYYVNKGQPFEGKDILKISPELKEGEYLTYTLNEKEYFDGEEIPFNEGSEIILSKKTKFTITIKNKNTITTQYLKEGEEFVFPENPLSKTTITSTFEGWTVKTKADTIYQPNNKIKVEQNIEVEAKYLPVIPPNEAEITENPNDPLIPSVNEITDDYEVIEVTPSNKIEQNPTPEPNPTPDPAPKPEPEPEPKPENPENPSQPNEPENKDKDKDEKKNELSDPSEEEESGNSKVGIIIGVTCGVIVLGIASIVTFFILKKRKSNTKNGVSAFKEAENLPSPNNNFKVNEKV